MKDIRKANQYRIPQLVKMQTKGPCAPGSEWGIYNTASMPEARKKGTWRFMNLKTGMTASWAADCLLGRIGRLLHELQAIWLCAQNLKDHTS